MQYCLLPDGKTDPEMMRKFYEYQTKAEIYHLYHSIQRYTVWLVSCSDSLRFFLQTYSPPFTSFIS